MYAPLCCWTPEWVLTASMHGGCMVMTATLCSCMCPVGCNYRYCEAATKALLIFCAPASDRSALTGTTRPTSSALWVLRGSDSNSFFSICLFVDNERATRCPEVLTECSVSASSTPKCNPARTASACLVRRLTSWSYSTCVILWERRVLWQDLSVAAFCSVCSKRASKSHCGGLSVEKWIKLINQFICSKQ